MEEMEHLTRIVEVLQEEVKKVRAGQGILVDIRRFLDATDRLATMAIEFSGTVTAVEKEIAEQKSLAEDKITEEKVRTQHEAGSVIERILQEQSDPSLRPALEALKDALRRGSYYKEPDELLFLVGKEIA